MNDAEFNCAYCGAPNVTTVDPSAGATQTYTEDCQVCCKPNELTVRIDRDTGEATIEARPATE